MPTEIIGDFSVNHTSDNQYINVSAIADTATYGPFPTKEEANEALGLTGYPLSFYTCFYRKSSLISSPKIPDEIYFTNSTVYGMFLECSSLTIAPKLPTRSAGGTIRFARWFSGCSSLTGAPVIPQIATDVRYMFNGCSSLIAPVSIPLNVSTAVSNMYENCVKLAGEFVVRPTSITYYANVLRGTTQPITIYGDRSLCEAIAATADNSNAAWSDWYEPVPAVTDRGQGSRTTAEDMTRMVRNGVLAVNSYAPSRMVYQQGDIVREDEWNALVEAAQIIDPTVTYSSNYANLNKIEAAFESAL